LSQFPLLDLIGATALGFIFHYYPSIYSSLTPTPNLISKIEGFGILNKIKMINGYVTANG